ncbi:MAG: ATP-binding cassette domain-containing protein [Anaeromyxobacter sp.]|nr:ATP-binding cassette domain-containing protein [Anaeromyxobacter sp.]MBL0276329.1 ATP-binding cassette domain-containing protein [Anaeromyxobacter sp.]
MLLPGQPIVTLERASVTLGGAPVLRRVSLALRAGDRLGVLGANGSGKSTLLRLLRGDQWLDPLRPGRRTFHVPDDPQQSPIGASERMATCGPEDQDAYARKELDLPVEAVIRSGLDGALYPADGPTPARAARVLAAARAMGVEPLLGRSILSLSRGEARAALVARALAPAPDVLLLDEVCDGLDAAARSRLLARLAAVAAGGTTVVTAVHRAEELFEGVDRALWLVAGRVAAAGGRAEVVARWREAFGRDRARRSSEAPPHPGPLPQRAGGEGEQTVDRARRRPLTPTRSPSELGERENNPGLPALPGESVSTARRPALLALPPGEGHSRSAPSPLRGEGRGDGIRRPPGSPPLPSGERAGVRGRCWPDLFRLSGVTVLVDGRAVLDRVSWRVRRGEAWAVTGPNGAGKSTLLRLLAGEEQPARGTIHRLDLGPRADAAQLRIRLGQVSPELQARHRFDASGADLVLSGFEGTIGLAGAPSAGQRRQAAAALAGLGLARLARRRILTCSYGELRLLLLARALAPAPDVLLLDEPFAGLDPRARAILGAAVERAVRAGVGLVLVTHHEDEVPAVVRRRARLEGGRLVET